jgi:amidase
LPQQYYGPFATTVSDAAALLSVLAERPERAQLSPARALRIAISVQPPNGRKPNPQEFAAAVARTAALLRAAGHHVAEATPHYGTIVSLESVG